MSDGFVMRLGAEVPNFACKTTEGDFQFHDFLGRNTLTPWTILMTHPKDYTPVCTTELGRAHQLIPEFTKRGVQLIALSCDPVADHQGWTKDVLANVGEDELISDAQVDADGMCGAVCGGGKPASALGFPIIADEKRDLVTLLSMLDPQAKDDAGLPLPARALVVIGPNKQVRLSILYPATTGRNFTEVLRLIDSLQLTQDLSLASPVDWKQGERMIVAPPVPTEDAKAKFQNFEIKELPSGKQYLRSVDCPR